MTDEVLEHPGGLVTFAVPYSDNDGRYLGVVTQEDIEYDQKNRVYHCKHLLYLSFKSSRVSVKSVPSFHSTFRSFYIPFVVHFLLSHHSTKLRGSLHGGRKILAPGKSQKAEQLFIHLHKEIVCLPSREGISDGG